MRLRVVRIGVSHVYEWEADVSYTPFEFDRNGQQPPSL